MSDSEHEEPPGKKRARGPYKKYLEPDQPFVIPPSTLRWRKQAKKRAKATVNQQVPSQASGNLSVLILQIFKL